MNENNATTKKTRGAQSRSRRSKKSSSGAVDQRSTKLKQTKQTTKPANVDAPPQLHGVLEKIKPVVELHRPRLAKAMADHAKAMLAIICDIRERLESIRKFDQVQPINDAAAAANATTAANAAAEPAANAAAAANQHMDEDNSIINLTGWTFNATNQPAHTKCP